MDKKIYSDHPFSRQLYPSRGTVWCVMSLIHFAGCMRIHWMKTRHFYKSLFIRKKIEKWKCLTLILLFVVSSFCRWNLKCILQNLNISVKVPPFPKHLFFILYILGVSSHQSSQSIYDLVTFSLPASRIFVSQNPFTNSQVFLPSATQIITLSNAFLLVFPTFIAIPMVFCVLLSLFVRCALF